MASESSLLDVSSFERAVYVDFEGNVDRVPTFVGVLCDGWFEQVILEPAFQKVSACYRPRPHAAPHGYAPIAPHQGHTSMRPVSLRTFTQELVQKCQAEDRRIVAWSQHEKHRLVEAASELSNQIETLYVDAKRHAKCWKARHHRHVRFVRSPRGGKHRLKSYFALVGYHVEPYFGVLHTIGGSIASSVAGEPRSTLEESCWSARWTRRVMGEPTSFLRCPAQMCP